MAPGTSAPLLSLRQVHAGYSGTIILENVDLDLNPGQCLAVLGRNGVGKTTLLRSIVGQAELRKGRVELSGVDISQLAPWRRARAGVGYVPQEREIFPSLSVEENLWVACRPGSTGTGERNRWDAESVYALFPRLRERRWNLGNQLSGGEQQMLAVGRALVGNPRVLLLDEPFEGLAPVIIDGLIEAIRQLRNVHAMALVLVEQHTQVALQMTEEALILDRGRVVHAGPSSALVGQAERLAEIMGIHSDMAR